MSRRRELVLAVVGCTAGAALALYAASRTWTVAVHPRPAPLPPVRQTRTGADLAPWLPALALVGLAGAGALVATRGVARLAVGGLLVGCGAGLGLAAAAASLGPWAVLCMVGGALVAAVGLATVWRGRSWPAMGARYDRAPAAEPRTSSELWDAIDRGADPTR